MVQLPEKLLASLEGVKGFERDSFISVHDAGEQLVSVRYNDHKVAKAPVTSPPFTGTRKLVPWCHSGQYLSDRPSFTFDPLFHAGLYYVQEASSMFLEQAWKQCVDPHKQHKVLDLSAAPGGKSTHILSLIPPDCLLVSNEVIRSRVNVLRDNIIKWGRPNVVVTHNDPKDFSRLEKYFDVMVVDAPCSGSGLFRRDPEAVGEWSENNVALCSQRQQRILADVMPALNDGGILIYSTCSYSKEEDEMICDWIISEFDFEPLKLEVDPLWGIVEAETIKGAYGYRFWPDKVKGEGFFISCFKRKGEREEFHPKAKQVLEPLSAKELKIVSTWVNTSFGTLNGNEADDNLIVLKHENTVYAWPISLEDEMNFLLGKLRVVYSGIRAGALMKDKFIPDHALAVSDLPANSVDSVVLNEEQAIQYLQRKDLKLEIEKKGWKLVTFKGHPLGWINVLPNRINNYYPKEFRILKETKSPPQ